MSDDVYFCAKCLAQLPLVHTEEEYCRKCGMFIANVEDFLTEAQWIARVAEDWRLEREAIASGLITPPGVREGERVAKTGECADE